MASLDGEARSAQSGFDEPAAGRSRARGAARRRRAEALSAVQREHAAAEAQLATLRQIQAAAEDNAPLARMAGAPPAWAAPRACGRSCASTTAGKPRSKRCCASGCTRSSWPTPAQLAAVLADHPPVRASAFEHGSRGADAPAAGAAARLQDPCRRPGDRRRGGRLAVRRRRRRRHAGPEDARGAAGRRGDGEPRRAPVHPPYGELPRAGPGRRRAARAPGGDRGAGEAAAGASAAGWRRREAAIAGRRGGARRAQRRAGAGAPGHRRDGRRRTTTRRSST